MDGGEARMQHLGEARMQHLRDRLVGLIIVGKSQNLSPFHLAGSKLTPLSQLFELGLLCLGEGNLVLFCHDTTGEGMRLSSQLYMSDSVWGCTR